MMMNTRRGRKEDGEGDNVDDEMDEDGGLT